MICWNDWKDKAVYSIIKEEIIVNGIDVYLVVGRFESGNQKYVIVRDNRGACTLTEKEWKRVYGLQHPKRWEKKGRIA